MKVYHGSYTAIKNIDFSFCRKNRDFGKGFYVTKFFSQAQYWAVRKGDDNDMEGVVTEFVFDESYFEDENLKVLRFENYSYEWLDFIAMNRTNRTGRQMHDYDIIEGPVADDDIATRVYDYIRKSITKEQFLKELVHKTPSHQISFCTMLSLQALELEKYDTDREMMNIDNCIVKFLITDYGMSERKATDIYYTSKTYRQFIDENTKLYLKPPQEIIKMLLSELNL